MAPLWIGVRCPSVVVDGGECAPPLSLPNFFRSCLFLWRPFLLPPTLVSSSKVWFLSSAVYFPSFTNIIPSISPLCPSFSSTCHPFSRYGLRYRLFLPLVSHLFLRPTLLPPIFLSNILNFFVFLVFSNPFHITVLCFLPVYSFLLLPPLPPNSFLSFPFLNLLFLFSFPLFLFFFLSAFPDFPSFFFGLNFLSHLFLLLPFPFSTVWFSLT